MHSPENRFTLMDCGLPPLVENVVREDGSILYNDHAVALASTLL